MPVHAGRHFAVASSMLAMPMPHLAMPLPPYAQALPMGSPQPPTSASEDLRTRVAQVSTNPQQAPVKISVPAWLRRAPALDTCL